MKVTGDCPCGRLTMRSEDYHTGFTHARSDSLLVLQLRVISLNTEAGEAKARGDASRASLCLFAAQVLQDVEHQIQRLQPESE